MTSADNYNPADFVVLEQDLEASGKEKEELGRAALQTPVSDDSSLKCCLQVLGVFIVWTNTWGLSNTFGVFQTYYESELLQSSTPSQISWIGSIQPFLLLGIGGVSGPLYDAGYFKPLLVVGNFFVVFGLMMTSLVTEYWQAILAQGITCGLGYGLMFIPGVSVLPQYFVKRRVLASGIAASGSGFGGLIYPIIFHALQPKIGFGWTVRVLGFISLFLALICIATLESKTKSGKMRKPFDYEAFTELPFLFNTIGLFFAMAGLYIPYYYIGTFGLRKHITGNALAFYLVPIMNASAIFGRIMPNLFADKTGVFNVLTPCTAIASILCFSWIGVHDTAGLVVFAILYGFFSGSFLSLPPVAVAVLTKDMKMLGTRTGTNFGAACFGVLIGTPICGVILGNSDNFVGLQIFGACCILAAAIFVGLARIAVAGFRWQKI